MDVLSDERRSCSSFSDFGVLCTITRLAVPLLTGRCVRVAAGSGTKVEDVNKLLKMHRQMADMMKAMGGAKRGGMAAALGLVDRSVADDVAARGAELTKQLLSYARRATLRPEKVRLSEFFRTCSRS